MHAAKKQSSGEARKERKKWNKYIEYFRHIVIARAFGKIATHNS